ncbi:MAG TPA: hypothetical protein VMY05_10705 [Acidobacteriota bacterium]|nr:hypothetical protein [Acidobacteriota bacterium]
MTDSNIDGTESPVSGLRAASLRLTARQIVVRDFLEKKAPGLSAMYHGVLFALSRRDNPERFVHAAQSCRELIRGLRRALPDVPQDSSPAQAIHKIRDLIVFEDGNHTDQQVRNEVAKLKPYYEATQVTRRQRHEGVIEHASQGPPPHDADKRKAAADLQGYEDWLSKIAHHGRQTTEAEFLRRLDAFESTLEVLAAEYFTVDQRVQNMMEKADPTESEFLELQRLLSLRPPLAAHFFRNLANPDWLPKLRQAGYFKRPVDIITHTGGGVSCPSWPQTTYLIRCAESNPELVATILMEVEETSNSRVHQELVEVALKLPASKVTDFAEKAVSWIYNTYHTITLLPIRLSELAAKLADEGESEMAFEVADRILDVRSDEAKYENQTEEVGSSLSPSAEAYVDDWDYEKMITVLERHLSKKAALKFIRVLCYKLAKAIRLESKYRKNEEEATDTDYTYISRPAIEDHEQNFRADSTKDYLIDHIRDSCVTAIRSGKEITAVIDVLRAYKYPVFRRIELYLLTEFPDEGMEHIGRWLSEVKNFDHEHIYHEFRRLLQRAFGSVPPGVQKHYLEWVENGPDVCSYKMRMKERYGNEPNDDQVRSYLARWRLTKYKPIKEYLDDKRRRVHEGLSELEKPDEGAEFPLYMTSWVGPTSPKDAKQLSDMAVGEVIVFLQSWRASGGYRASSPEGLGRFLRDDVRSRAMEYAEIAGTIQPGFLRPVYLYYLFSGLEDATKDARQLNWSEVLLLADRIVFANNLPEPDQSAGEFETGWEGVRKAIASLFSQALGDINVIASRFRDAIWKLIEKLTHEGEPTSFYEEQYGGSNLSPVDMSINTVRGQAAHALFQYLLWVDRNANEGVESNEQKHNIPEEALPILERFLDTSQEATLTIRSVLAWYVQCLAGLDLEWTREHLDKLIPAEKELLRYRNAAFEGYFSFNKPNGYLFKNLRDFFMEAFIWANENGWHDEFHRAKENFVAHAAVYYWWGIDPLTGHDCLIKRVFAEGQLKLRAHALEHIGRSLETLLPIAEDGPQALERLQRLLEWRLTELAKSSVCDEERTEELKEFGWWFTYAQMDESWLLDKLVEILNVTRGQIEWAHKVLERLISFVPTSPIKVAECVNAIVQGDPSPWNIDYWTAHLDNLFKAIRESQDQDAWYICRGTINYLGDRGFRSFGSLL